VESLAGMAACHVTLFGHDAFWFPRRRSGRAVLTPCQAFPFMGIALRKAPELVAERFEESFCGVVPGRAGRVERHRVAARQLKVDHKRSDGRVLVLGDLLRPVAKGAGAGVGRGRLTGTRGRAATTPAPGPEVLPSDATHAA